VDSQANAGRDLEGLIVQPEVGGAGAASSLMLPDRVKVLWRRPWVHVDHQPGVPDCIEGPADTCG
jgi:hypothetical protein